MAGFENTFYIRQLRDEDNGYALYVQGTHYCLAGCVSLTHCLNLIKRYVITYKTQDSFIAALHSMNDKGNVTSKSCFEEQQAYFNTGAWKKWNVYVNEVINEGLLFIKEQSPAERVKKFRKLRPLKKVMQEDTVIPPVKEDTNKEEQVIRPVNRRTIKKPVLCKRFN